MTPEAVIQGELNIHRLSESLVLGFRSDNIVRLLNKAFLGSKLEEKYTAGLDNTEKFLFEMASDLRNGGPFNRDTQLAMVRFKQQGGRNVPLFQDPKETLQHLDEFQDTILNVERGVEVDKGKIGEVLGFFVSFSQVQLDKSQIYR